MKSLEEIRAAERDRLGAGVRVVGIAVPFADVLALMVKVVAALAVVGIPIGLVVALIA